MDNLENELFESLKQEFSDDINEHFSGVDVLEELKKPIDQMDSKWTDHWLGDLPIALRDRWASLPMSTRVTVWILCGRLNWKEDMIQDFEAFQSRLLGNQ